MYQRIVLTAGISLLTNKRKEIEEKFPHFFTQPDRITKENEDDIVEMTKTIKNMIVEEPFHKFLSAEISMISALDAQDKLHNKPVITIFHTDTVKGVIAAEIIKELLERQFLAYVHLRKIVNVDMKNRRSLSKSLGYFLSGVSDALLEGVPSTTCFAPIGGFKIWAFLGYLVGAFHGYPTAYLHENSTVLHEIPPVHIQVNESFIEEYHPFLRKIMKEEILQMEELTESEKNLIVQEPTLFTIEEDLVELNPFARFLCNQSKFSHYFQSSVSIDQSVLQWLEKKYPSNMRYVMREINDLIVKHRDFLLEEEGVLFHEKAYIGLNKGELDCHLFKGGNNPVFRAIWHYDPMEDHYYIGQIWINHMVYERQVVSFLQSFDLKNTVWEDITDKVYRS